MPLLRAIKTSTTLRAIIDFSYTRPRRFIGSIFSKATFRKLVNQIYDPTQSDERKAMSTALGVFIGIMPIWGFQTLIAIGLAVAFRLNKALVFMFSHVSFPPLIPLVVFASYHVGHYWMGAHAGHLSFDKHFSFKSLDGQLEQYLYGSISLAVAAGIVVGLLTFATLKLSKAIKQYRLTSE